MDAVSLARALSKLGYASRAEARRLIDAGRVAVNGEVVRDAERRVDVRHAHITVDGHAVRAAARVYLAMNKPRGAVTTTNDQHGRITVYDLLPDGLPRLVAVGRLDAESEGLLLFTNDTRWADRIVDPRTHVDKVYHVLLERPLTPAELDTARAGVRVSRGEMLQLPHIETMPGEDARIRVVLQEGRNRQIRRVLEAIGVGVERLVRVAIGPIALGKLESGLTRPLSADEVKAVDPGRGGSAS